MSTGQEKIKWGKHEFVKQFFVYDLQGRTTDIYEAPAGAVHGQPCMVTSYAYIGASGQIEKSNETHAVWDSSYDI